MMSTNPSALPVDASQTTTVPWERIERFVGQLTHDVRNGLNALELQLTFLSEISTDPEAVEEVKRIRQTVSDITRKLQTVHAATSVVSLNLLDYPAKDFFEDLQERFERREPASKTRLHWEIAVGTATLSIDPETTMAAFLELIANALQFNRREHAATVSASVATDCGVVALQEFEVEAPAITAEEWGRTPLLTHRRGAYGLGLFRARRIIEAQGGTLERTYAAQDKVLTTTVTLPVSRLP